MDNVHHIEILRTTALPGGEERVEIAALGRISRDDRWCTVEVWPASTKRSRQRPPTSLTIAALLVMQWCAGDEVSTGSWTIRRARQRPTSPRTPAGNLITLTWPRTPARRGR